MKITNEGFAVIEGDECISKWVIEEKRLDHDQNSLPIILNYINKDSIVIDAGSFIGDHTIAYARKAKEVIAFEPNLEAFKCLEFNLREFPNVDLWNMGLSDSVCAISLTDVPTNAGMTYAEKSKTGVSCITIDFLDLEKLDFIKIDCEGFELNILKGGAQTIEKFKPVMVIEINKHALERNKTSNLEVFNYLDSIGYNYKNIYEGQGILDEQLDLLCTPKL